MGYREIGYGEADLDIVRELNAKIRKQSGVDFLISCEPPLAQSVYVCSWCVRLVDRVDLNWEDGDGRAVCDACASVFFNKEDNE